MGYEHVEGHLEVFHPDTGSFLADDNNRLFSYFTSGEQCNEGVKRIGTVSGRAREDNFQAYGAGFTLVVVDTSPRIGSNAVQKFYEAGPRVYSKKILIENPAAKIMMQPFYTS